MQPDLLTLVYRYDKILALGPHRLVAQDAALSRPKRGFEFPWGHLILFQSCVKQGFALFECYKISLHLQMCSARGTLY